MFIKDDQVEILHDGKVVATGKIVCKSAIVKNAWIVTHSYSHRNVTFNEKDLRKISSDSTTGSAGNS